MSCLKAAPTRLDALMRQLDLSNEDLAKATGLSAQTIRALRRGNHPPSLPTARAIQDAFGKASLEAIFPREEAEAHAA